MFYKFKKGKQRELIQKAITKAGSERKLAKMTGIPNGSIYNLKFEKRNLSESNVMKLLNFLNIEKKEIQREVLEILPDNWGQIKGGKNLIKKKIKEGTLEETIERLKKASSKRMKKWHKDMKENEPKRYYIWQYERFKKIGKGYPFTLLNGIKVRNLLEKEVGDLLVNNFSSFMYEPYLNIGSKAYFPDFIYENIIIEVTEWKHPDKDKIQKLIRKSKDYKKEGFIVCFFIPERYRKFYKEIKSPIISTLPELKEFINASVA